MILLTVGTQLPFDRLVGEMDRWLGAHPEVECIGQIGETRLQPRHMEFTGLLTSDQARLRMGEADLVVAHAGMGTVISALRMGKPVLIMPRQCRYGEHRNDHQMATAAALRRRPNVYVAMDESELGARLDELNPVRPFEGEPLGPHASPELLAAVREFIGGSGGPRRDG